MFCGTMLGVLLDISFFSASVCGCLFCSCVLLLCVCVCVFAEQQFHVYLSSVTSLVVSCLKTILVIGVIFGPHGVARCSVAASQLQGSFLSSACSLCGVSRFPRFHTGFHLFPPQNMLVALNFPWCLMILTAWPICDTWANVGIKRKK